VLQPHLAADLRHLLVGLDVGFLDGDHVAIDVGRHGTLLEGLRKDAIHVDAIEDVGNLERIDPSV
jgi:hypothetical protein